MGSGKNKNKPGKADAKHAARSTASAAAPALDGANVTREEVLKSSSPWNWNRLALAGAVVALLVSVLAAGGVNPFASAPAPPSKAANVAKAAKETASKEAPTHAKPGMLTVKQIKERAAQQPCKNKADENFCHQSAATGQCDVSPGWMAVKCAASCARCHLLNPKVRCSKENMNISMVNTYGPGDISKVFENIRSRPELQGKVEMLLDDPQMLVIRDFVTEYEGRRLLELTKDNLKRSTDQGGFDEAGVQEQVVSMGRTSSNAWCIGPCEADPTVRNLLNRIAELTLSSPLNFESFQVLRYQLGQKYDTHHDGSNDNHMHVEEGGETFFPQLDIKVKPQRGSALLWPSVLDRDPRAVDPRTTHAALPVIKGTKYAANVWIHLRDYVTPNLWGCTGKVLS